MGVGQQKVVFGACCFGVLNTEVDPANAALAIEPFAVSGLQTSC